MKNIVLKFITFVALCLLFLGISALDSTNLIIPISMIIISLIWLIPFYYINQYYRFM